jgi:hypothetical protein
MKGGGKTQSGRKKGKKKNYDEENEKGSSINFLSFI